MEPKYMKMHSVAPIAEGLGGRVIVGQEVTYGVLGRVSTDIYNFSLQRQQCNYDYAPLFESFVT